jgi:hypothetical protein
MPAAPLPSHPSPAPQATLLWAVRLLAAESVALVGLVIFLAYEGLSSDADNVRVALGVTLFAAFLAALLGGLGNAAVGGPAGRRSCCNCCCYPSVIRSSAAGCGGSDSW